MYDDSHKKNIPITEPGVDSRSWVRSIAKGRPGIKCILMDIAVGHTCTDVWVQINRCMRLCVYTSRVNARETIKNPDTQLP